MQKTNLPTLGKKMQQVRKVMNLTQSELAKRLYVSRSCLANYESNRRSPSVQMLKHFAQELNVNLDYFGECEASFDANAKLNQYDADIASCLTKLSHLDLSEESPIVKIAVVEYYLHLKGKYKL